MGVSNGKTEATRRPGKQHPPPTPHPGQPLTSKHDVKSLLHMKQVVGTTIHKVRPWDIARSYRCLTSLYCIDNEFYEISPVAEMNGMLTTSPWTWYAYLSTNKLIRALNIILIKNSRILVDNHTCVWQTFQHLRSQIRETFKFSRKIREGCVQICEGWVQICERFYFIKKVGNEYKNKQIYFL